MKMILFVVLALTGFNAVANDSSVPVISVKGVDPMNTPSGSSFKVYGGNVDTLFNVLPTMGIAADEATRAEFASQYRTVRLESKGWYVNITCSKQNFETGAPLAEGTACEFSLTKKVAGEDEDYGDSFEWDSSAVKACLP